MRYFHDIDGVELKRDCYAEQFDTEVKFNYWVTIYGECVGEDENPKRLARQLEKQAKRILKIAKFLSRKTV